ncbi:hypothetical protein [Pseudodesulfovibrio senegalensis]|jgi:hypothetical protein|uniref:Uncharacterized protein n=1 Tax=Pseudodesulfovibrio senegalensis TaxID=1721087 RepID=A0A6N6N710_9BACT|nr:hypothetical protein [Pseudodesulfovibrio senegalensis]KAB1443508.1 hypothetical protein F8A88_04480 [Pseudodesulfovibrio senegalensis]
MIVVCCVSLANNYFFPKGKLSHVVFYSLRKRQLVDFIPGMKWWGFRFENVGKQALTAVGKLEQERANGRRRLYNVGFQTKTFSGD